MSIWPQSRYARGACFVGRYERLAQDVAKIAERIGLTVPVQHINASGDPIRYRDLMTARSQAIIADFYCEDIERFGYR